MNLTTYMKVFFLGGEEAGRGFGSSGATSPLEPKETKGDEGTEGGHKFGKMGRHRLWMMVH